MTQAKWYLVCYDVRDDKRLRRAAKKLEGRGERLQYSVFRCWLTKRQLQELRWELTEILEPEDDTLFIPICGRCVQGITVTHSTHNEPDWESVPPTFDLI